MSNPLEIPKKPRLGRKLGLKDMAVPVRLHIYGFLNKCDVHCPYTYGSNIYEESANCQFFDEFQFDDSYAIMTAISSSLGDVDALSYMQNMPENPWLIQTCDDSQEKKDFLCFLSVLLLGYRNFQTFQWARSKNLPWNSWTFEVGLYIGLDLKILQWLHRKGCPLSNDAFNIAVSWRDINVLKWLHEVGCPWGTRTFACAIRERRDWEILIWLKTNGCPWDENSLGFAIQNNDNLLLIQYLLKENCPTDEYTATLVVKTGNVEALKLLGDSDYNFHYGVEMGEHYLGMAISMGKSIEFLASLTDYCPWDSSCFDYAIVRRDMEILRWMKYKGCPFHQEDFAFAIKWGTLDIIRFFYEQNYPPSTEPAFRALMEKYLQLAK